MCQVFLWPLLLAIWWHQGNFSSTSPGRQHKRDCLTLLYISLYCTSYYIILHIILHALHYCTFHITFCHLTLHYFKSTCTVCPMLYFGWSRLEARSSSNVTSIELLIKCQYDTVCFVLVISISPLHSQMYFHVVQMQKTQTQQQSVLWQRCYGLLFIAVLNNTIIQYHNKGRVQ